MDKMPYILSRLKTDENISVLKSNKGVNILYVVHCA